MAHRGRSSALLLRRHGGVLLETENIAFDSMEEMPPMELFRQGRPACVWDCRLTALRFKTAGSKCRFVFRPQEAQ